MTALLWCIGAAATTCIAAATWLHIDLWRASRRAHRTQNELNRDGR